MRILKNVYEIITFWHPNAALLFNLNASDIQLQLLPSNWPILPTILTQDTFLGELTNIRMRS
jgi:hypothetical protein